jgi:hypothetical protein
MSSTGAAAPRPCICIGWPGQRRRAYEAATRRRQRSALCGAARMGAAAAAIPAMQVTAAELTRAGSSCIAITIGTLYGNEKAYGVWLKLLYYAVRPYEYFVSEEHRDHAWTWSWTDVPPATARHLHGSVS